MVVFERVSVSGRLSRAAAGGGRGQQRAVADAFTRRERSSLDHVRATDQRWRCVQLQNYTCRPTAMLDFASPRQQDSLGCDFIVAALPSVGCLARSTHAQLGLRIDAHVKLDNMRRGGGRRSPLRSSCAGAFHSQQPPSATPARRNGYGGLTLSLKYLRLSVTMFPAERGCVSIIPA